MGWWTGAQFVVMDARVWPFPSMHSECPQTYTSFGQRIAHEIVDCILDGGDLVCLCIRDFHPKLLLQRHHQLHNV
eukprot:1161816-Pelagomonas_calceolata.AAC.6